MKMGNQVGRPTLYATNFAPVSLSYATSALLFWILFIGDMDPRTCLPWLLLSWPPWPLIPTQAHHPWFPASQLPPQQAETTVEPYATAETARQRENNAVEVENPVLASLSSPAQSMDKLESEIHCLQSRLGLLRSILHNAKLEAGGHEPHTEQN
ncbi:uncharacterized protein LOC121263173 [Juglans microcarpa x Juglans regia]|uniref:uncharacterized protein LOC121263173 n=1 Tax=Juglans microcarpa x Juglans regia TaxID=2249226 RepID=UPI001B7E63A1|nr:uncharacterized protein LOC121263173 [Juglans microcarpa x Juglans regia]